MELLYQSADVPLALNRTNSYLFTVENAEGTATFESAQVIIIGDITGPAHFGETVRRPVEEWNQFNLSPPHGRSLQALWPLDRRKPPWLIDLSIGTYADDTCKVYCGNTRAEACMSQVASSVELDRQLEK